MKFKQQLKYAIITIMLLVAFVTFGIDLYNNHDVVDIAELGLLFVIVVAIEYYLRRKRNDER